MKGDDYVQWDEVLFYHASEFSRLIGTKSFADEPEMQRCFRSRFEGKPECAVYSRLDEVSGRESRIDIGYLVQVEKPMHLELKLIRKVSAHCAQLCFDVLKLHKVLLIACQEMSPEDVALQARILRLLVRDVPCSVAYFHNCIVVWVDPHWGGDSLGTRLKARELKPFQVNIEL